MAASASARGAGSPMHTSSTMAMSGPKSSWQRTACSGVRKSFDPS